MRAKGPLLIAPMPILVYMAFSFGRFEACYSPRSLSHGVEVAQHNSVAAATPRRDRKEVLKLVKTFSGAEGEESDAAWVKLSAYPRQELIDTLRQTSGDLPPDDHHRVLVAFVLCCFDYEYKDNRQIIINSLTEKPAYRDFYADWPADLINRLINRSDKELLTHLFAATEWADGAFSASLSGYLSTHMKDDPHTFLSALRLEPEPTRQRVYRQIRRDELLSEEDVRKVRTYLSSVNRESDLSQVAKEMLAAL